jgi:hypothetical protein
VLVLGRAAGVVDTSAETAETASARHSSFYRWAQTEAAARQGSKCRKEKMLLGLRKVPTTEKSIPTLH